MIDKKKRHKIITLSVGILIHKKKVLFLKRNKPPFVGLWSLPGGKLEFGEQIEECAVREFWEETGIKTEFAGLRGIVSEFICHEGEKDGHFLIYVCALKPKGPIELKESEEGELKWFDLHKLEENKTKIVGSDIVMITELVLGQGENLKIHKSIMKKDGEKYILESFEAD